MRHICDNTLCVRPDHLVIGTEADNTADMMLRDRCRTIKLTDSEVEEIRQKYAAGTVTQQELANSYHTSHSNISLIVNRITRWHKT